MARFRFRSYFNQVTGLFAWFSLFLKGPTLVQTPIASQISKVIMDENNVSLDLQDVANGYDETLVNNILHNNATNQPSMSISAIFFPGAREETGDTGLISTDGVYFRVLRARLEAASTNSFGGILRDTSYNTFFMTQSFQVVTLLLCFVYGLEPSNVNPSLDLIEQALQLFSKYGLSLDWSSDALQPFKRLLLAHSRERPLDVYAVGAYNNWEELAVDSSAFCLNEPLQFLTDSLCTKIGPLYLRRLILLHLSRESQLRELLRQYPATHMQSGTCGTVDQRAVQQQWNRCASLLLWDIHPAYPVLELYQVFISIVDTTPCIACKNAIKARVQGLVIDWGSVKQTI